MKPAYRTGWCGSGNHARCTGSAGTPDRRAERRCECHKENPMLKATATIDLTQPVQAIRDQITALADVLDAAGQVLQHTADELYTVAAPDTDVADEDAIARRTINNPVIREAADEIAAQGVNVGVEKL